MGNYLIKFFDKTTLEITEEDYKNLIGKDGLVFLKSVGQSFNTSNIARIVPVSQADQLEDKRNQNEGVLHDGTVVIRHFGSWYMDGEFDADGKPTRRIDSTYYPEVARDCVVSKKEFETKYKALPRPERLKLMCEGTREPGVRGLKSVGGLLEGSIKKIEQKHEQGKN